MNAPLHGKQTFYVLEDEILGLAHPQDLDHDREERAPWIFDPPLLACTAKRLAREARRQQLMRRHFIEDFRHVPLADRVRAKSSAVHITSFRAQVVRPNCPNAVSIRRNAEPTDACKKFDRIHQRFPSSCRSRRDNASRSSVSHCQTTITSQPFAANSRKFRRSRRRFAANLCCQNSLLVRGIVVFGHLACLCQKHPWTNITLRRPANTRSGLPGRRPCKRNR